jgi:dephospho-CoA kinase
MKLFGLTGGIGMGKSAAAQILVQRGVSVIDTDVLARSVAAPGQPALAEIRSAFGDAVISTDGSLRRDVLARIVFSDPQARQKLEAITHPRIRDLWKRQIEQWRGQRVPAACVVIPLLFETNAESEFDATICIACSAATQQERLLERRWNVEQIAQRIAAQFSIDKKIAKASYVIWNEGGLDILAAQLDSILNRQAALRKVGDEVTSL